MDEHISRILSISSLSSLPISLLSGNGDDKGETIGVIARSSVATSPIVHIFSHRRHEMYPDRMMITCTASQSATSSSFVSSVPINSNRKRKVVAIEIDDDNDLDKVDDKKATKQIKQSKEASSSSKTKRHHSGRMSTSDNHHASDNATLEYRWITHNILIANIQRKDNNDASIGLTKGMHKLLSWCMAPSDEASTNVSTNRRGRSSLSTSKTPLSSSSSSGTLRKKPNTKTKKSNTLTNKNNTKRIHSSTSMVIGNDEVSDSKQSITTQTRKKRTIVVGGAKSKQNNKVIESSNEGTGDDDDDIVEGEEKIRVSNDGDGDEAVSDEEEEEQLMKAIAASLNVPPKRAAKSFTNTKGSPIVIEDVIVID
jgi:hypothetical protein